jgi:hypothetical protein
MLADAAQAIDKTGLDATAEPQGQATPADVRRYWRYLRSFETAKDAELKEGATHSKYYHDKQWTDAEKKKLKKRNQPEVVDNLIKRKIDFLVGVEQRMRRDPQAYPRTPKHEQDADVATAGIRFVCDQNRWDNLSSEGMHHGLVQGKGFAWIGITNGPKGNDVAIEICDPGRAFYDPRSIKPDFSDARYMGVQLWQDVDEVKEAHPDKSAEIDKLADGSSSPSSRIAIPADNDQDLQWTDLDARRVRIVEIYEKRLAPPMMKAVWYYCKFSGDVVLQSMISPYQDEYGQPACPYEAWSPYIDEAGVRYGLIRTMQTMQDEVNHRRSRALHELNNRQTFSNTPGAVDDVEALKAEINKPDGHLSFNAGEWNKTVGIVDRTNQLKGQLEMLQQSIQRMENYGPNPGLIGQGGGVADQSGRAILAQRDSGMTELSPVFERQRNWKLRVYRAIWARIRQAWTAERWIAITDEESDVQHLPINQYQMVMDPETGQPRISAQNVVAQIDVDIILDEGPDTIVMQEELMQTLSQLGNTPPQLWKVFVELSQVNRKDQLIKMIDEAMAPPPDQAEMAAKMARIEQMLASIKVDGEAAKVEKTRADTISTLLTAFTPQAPQTHEDKLTGQVTQLPAAPPPDINAALQAMQLFPLTYPNPTIGEQDQAEAMQPQMPQGPMDGGQLQETPQGGPPMPQPGMLPPPGQPMPGGMPVGP